MDHDVKHIDTLDIVDYEKKDVPGLVNVLF